MTWWPSHACCLFVYCLFNNTVQVRFLSGTGADRFFAKAIPFHSMEEQQQRKEMIGGGAERCVSRKSKKAGSKRGILMIRAHGGCRRLWAALGGSVLHPHLHYSRMRFSRCRIPSAPRSASALVSACFHASAGSRIVTRTPYKSRL